MRAIERVHAGTGNRNRTAGGPSKTDTERALNALVPAGNLTTASGVPLLYFGAWIRKHFPKQFDDVHRRMSGIE